MSRQILRLRRLRAIAVGLAAASLALPAAAHGANDLRGEFSKAPAAGPSLSAAADLRGEYSKDAAAATEFPWSENYRGGESKADFPGTEPAPVVAAPGDATEPTGGPDALPFIVSGLVLLIGLGLAAIVVPLTRRLRVGS